MSTGSARWSLLAAAVLLAVGSAVSFSIRTGPVPAAAPVGADGHNGRPAGADHAAA